MRCFAYDSKRKFLIVGGKTSGGDGSFDFAPTSDDHGYLFALGTDQGDWQWGNFFYNVSYPIQSIDGCQMSTSGDSIAVTGLSNDMPFVMKVDPADGSVITFAHLEDVRQEGHEASSFATFGAVLLDDVDETSTVYTAFK